MTEENNGLKRKTSQCREQNDELDLETMNAKKSVKQDDTTL